MKPWELAKYLIDAKKCVDSILYIEENAKQLRYYDLKELIDGKRNTFYINCCGIIDKTIVTCKGAKRELCVRDKIVELLYLERDKNSAHKDDDYIPQQFDKISNIAEQMKEQLNHVRHICSDYLPKEITLDFVPHDKALFRAVHKLLADDEEALLAKKYPLKQAIVWQDENAKAFPILNDTLELRTLSEEAQKNYAVVINNGINMYEGVQERQDSCIKINLLYNQNVWCNIEKSKLKQYTELFKLGAIDEYGKIQPLPTDPIIRSRIEKILMNNQQK